MGKMAVQGQGVVVRASMLCQWAAVARSRRWGRRATADVDSHGWFTEKLVVHFYPGAEGTAASN